RKQLENAARLCGARYIVVAGDEHDATLRQRPLETRKVDECVQDRGVARPNGVEHVAGDDDDLRRELDHSIDRQLERSRDIRFPLVDAAGSQSLVLSEAEVEVGEVDEAQAAGKARA